MPTTFNSSTADLSLPAGATVLFAGLYWGGDTSAGAAAVRRRRGSQPRTVLLAPPGGGYASVTASTLDGSTAAPTRYQGFADVTAAVQAGGPAPTPSPTCRPAPARIATPAGDWWSPTTTLRSLPGT